MAKKSQSPLFAPTGSKNQQVSHNHRNINHRYGIYITRSLAITDHVAKESHHWLVRCHDLRQRKSADNKTTQWVNPHAWRPTVWTETAEPTTYTNGQRPMTVFWSRAHRQRHVTICLHIV